MATKVFISWSGDLSKKLGEALREWLPAALQYVRPYFTPEDIEKGTKWNTEIAKELETSNVGIICLTQDNTEKPWILFEAGALSKSIDNSRVCTLLFNLEPSEVKGPLTGFQATRFAIDDFKRLVATINSTAGDSKLEPQVLDEVFDMWWPRLEERINKIIGSHDKKSKKDRRSERDMLEEILQLARLNSTRASRNLRSRPDLLSAYTRDLAGIIAEELSLLPHDFSDRIVHRLIPPLAAMSREIGTPDILDYFRMKLGVPPAYESSADEILQEEFFKDRMITRHELVRRERERERERDQ